MPELQDLEQLKTSAIELLKQLINTPSISRNEEATADLLQQFLEAQHIPTERKLNNVWAKNKHFDKNKPSILLNSHHDTVKPNPAYTNDPFHAFTKDGKLYGLGSNDAGGAVVSLLSAFLYFYNEQNLKYNFIYAASAEEETSGKNGIASVLQDFPPIDFAIVGEPTLMEMATAEKGLMVLDCSVYGKSGHAAREEGENAIYNALPVIQWFRDYQFEKVSSMLGKVKMTVTVIKAGEQHNVVPALCDFTVDVRTTDAYRNEEILEIIEKQANCNVLPRSLRLQPSSIPEDHPIVQAGKSAGRKTYGSPTTSDQALMPWPSIKIGPGDSARSHTANEFIYIKEIEEAIELYITLLKKLN